MITLCRVTVCLICSILLSAIWITISLSLSPYIDAFIIMSIYSFLCIIYATQTAVFSFLEKKTISKVTRYLYASSVPIFVIFIPLLNVFGSYNFLDQTDSKLKIVIKRWTILLALLSSVYIFFVEHTCLDKYCRWNVLESNAIRPAQNVDIDSFEKERQSGYNIQVNHTRLENTAQNEKSLTRIIAKHLFLAILTTVTIYAINFHIPALIILVQSYLYTINLSIFVIATNCLLLPLRIFIQFSAIKISKLVLQNVEIQKDVKEKFMIPFIILANDVIISTITFNYIIRDFSISSCAVQLLFLHLSEPLILIIFGTTSYSKVVKFLTKIFKKYIRQKPNHTNVNIEESPNVYGIEENQFIKIGLRCVGMGRIIGLFLNIALYIIYSIIANINVPTSASNLFFNNYYLLKRNDMA